MNANDLQIMHIAAGKELRSFRNMIAGAERYEAHATTGLLNPAYSSKVASEYRTAAEECMKRYREIMRNIILYTSNLIICSQ